MSNDDDNNVTKIANEFYTEHLQATRAMIANLTAMADGIPDEQANTRFLFRRAVSSLNDALSFIESAGCSVRFAIAAAREAKTTGVGAEVALDAGRLGVKP